MSSFCLFPDQTALQQRLVDRRAYHFHGIFFFVEPLVTHLLADVSFLRRSALMFGNNRSSPCVERFGPPMAVSARATMTAFGVDSFLPTLAKLQVVSLIFGLITFASASPLQQPACRRTKVAVLYVLNSHPFKDFNVVTELHSWI